MNLPWLDEHKQSLDRRLNNNHLGHAPLIQGPRGVGKRALAHWLTARILCLEPTDGSPCGRCRSCELLDHGAHPDYFPVAVPEDKQVIPVDLVRDLIGKMQLTPAISRARVGLFVDADAMNRNAANALLKTLEEPPAGAWLILCSDQPASLPATVRSRCQRLVLRPPPGQQADQWLSESCPDTDGQRRAAALALAGGAPLVARDLLEKEELERGFGILEQLLSPELGARSAEWLQHWQVDAASTWQWIARWLVVLMKQGGGAGDDLFIPERQQLPRDLPPRQLARLWERALEGRRAARSGALRQDLALGQWLLEWQSMIGNGNQR
ncbi:DNA polymerase III subunit delta' [Wenzhouxiangella sp. AB-CW3]|uniref:DNA polymerase III subunit delta' n=1 Tax=Wenzhouxiangella sp. AB-CW3 TaxID=2771012 RepID=UPI00168BEBBC|nr:DNA polymerase III subunit delta' [Wenzhouxiangella sp. AB-CW3]QOC24008.1 DNA polymerase III subunit delta' [Wenzhouxiangella sp. AB-CW3]